MEGKEERRRERTKGGEREDKEREGERERAHNNLMYIFKPPRSI